MKKKVYSKMVCPLSQKYLLGQMKIGYFSFSYLNFLPIRINIELRGRRK